MPTSRAIADELESVLDYLTETGIALLRSSVSRAPERVSWHGSDAFRISHGSNVGLTEYLDWLDSGNFSALMFDGSLLQITYDFSGNLVVGHRLCYVPCPYDLDPEEVETFPIADLVRDAAAVPTQSRLRFRTAIRFDYDSVAASIGHPASHLTINSDSCRIPCLAPLRLGSFLRMTLEHFYPDIWRGHRFLRAMSAGAIGKASILPEEQQALYISWR